MKKRQSFRRNTPYNHSIELKKSQTEGNDFMNEEKLFSGGFFTGVNYWALKNATNMWEDFDEASIEEDMKAMAAAGVTHLRVFPTWHVFQPLKALYTTRLTPYEYRFGEEARPDTEAGRAGVSEEACRKFERFCDLSEQYGFKLVVGLITGHMSFREFAPPAFEGRQRLSDPTVLKWQLRFVRYFVRRFKDRAAIAGWDLGNEVNNMASGEGFVKDDFYVWCSAIADAVRACDPAHPVVSGMDALSIEKDASNYEVIRETCDIHTCHPYNIFATQGDPLPSMKPVCDLTARCRYGEDIAGVPTFVQEFGSIGYLNCSPKTEADFYRACLYATLAHGCHGVMWWCAFDQGQLRFAPYEWNNIGSDYGFFDRERRAKPIAGENLKFQALLKKLPGGELPAHRTDGVILVPRDNGDADYGTARAAFMLAERAGYDLRFAYALDPIPDAPLYILPSLRTTQSITATRLDQLLEKVAAGAVLFLSLDDTLFRRIPEITGVQMAWRACVPAERTVTFRGEELPLHAPVRYEVESADAEILARDETGAPCFFRHAYGRGQVFFMTMPFERGADTHPGAFSEDNAPAYELVYKALFEAAGIRRRVTVDSPFVHATEHPATEKSGYVVFVNYDRRPRTVRVGLNGAALTPVHNGLIKDGTLTLGANDGAVFAYRDV